MADQTESSPVGEGAVVEGQPQPASTPSDVQRTSVDVEAIAAFFDTDQGKELLDRRAQSIKDRRFAEQDKQLSGIKETLERLDDKMKQQGLSREQAIYQMELEDRLNRLEGNPVVTTSSESVTQAKVEPTQSINVEPLLRAVGIDVNDPRVTEFYKSGDSKTSAGVLNFISKMKLQQPMPTPAQSMPTGGGYTPAQRDEAVVNAELQTVINTVPLDAAKLKKLRQELQSITNK